jgi:hypothetical protein
MVSLIMATDLQSHFDVINSFRQKVEAHQLDGMLVAEAESIPTTMERKPLQDTVVPMEVGQARQRRVCVASGVGKLTARRGSRAALAHSASVPPRGDAGLLRRPLRVDGGVQERVTAGHSLPIRRPAQADRSGSAPQRAQE